jgi:hypothetical protein
MKTDAANWVRSLVLELACTPKPPNKATACRNIALRTEKFKVLSSNKQKLTEYPFQMSAVLASKLWSGHDRLKVYFREK